MYIYPSFFAFLFYKIEKILGVLKCRYYEAKGVSKVHEWCLFYTDL